MPDLELRVELTDDRDVYHPGDTVTGTVEVVPDEEVRCSELTVTRRWETSGDGTPDGGKEATQTVFEGDETWYGAGHYAYDFETDIPAAGPYNYIGRHVEVDWVVEATADLPWAFDPSGKATIRVEPAGDEETYRPGGAPLEEVEEKLLAEEESSPGCGLGFGLLLAAPALVLVFAFGAPDCSNAEAAEGYLKTLITGIAGIWIVGMSIRQLIANSTFENVEFGIDADRVTPGEEVEATLAVPGRLQPYCRDLDLELVRIEEAEDDQGKGSTTFNHTFEVDSRTPADFDPDEESRKLHTYTETFEIPENADYSMWSEHNQVTWGVRAAIDAPWWPDWETTEPLFVHPETDS